MSPLAVLPRELQGVWEMQQRSADRGTTVEMVKDAVKREAAFRFTGNNWGIHNSLARQALGDTQGRFVLLAKGPEVDGLQTYFLVLELLGERMLWVVHGPVDGGLVLVRKMDNSGDEEYRSVCLIK